MQGFTPAVSFTLAAKFLLDARLTPTVSFTPAVKFLHDARLTPAAKFLLDAKAYTRSQTLQVDRAKLQQQRLKIIPFIHYTYYTL